MDVGADPQRVKCPEKKQEIHLLNDHWKNQGLRKKHELTARFHENEICLTRKRMVMVQQIEEKELEAKN